MIQYTGSPRRWIELAFRPNPFVLATLLLSVLALSGCKPENGTTSPAETRNVRTLTLRDGNGAVLIADDDIASNDDETHIVTLAGGVREELSNRLASQLVGGLPFELYADGSLCYTGNLTTFLSSTSLDTVAIDLHGAGLGDDQIQISLGYPTPNCFAGDGDPRNNEAVVAVLKSLGKIKQNAK